MRSAAHRLRHEATRRGGFEFRDRPSYFGGSMVSKQGADAADINVRTLVFQSLVSTAQATVGRANGKC
jgi:hypothetical protein